MRAIAKLTALGISVAIVLAACGTASAPAAAKRTVYMSAVEYKGGANVTSEVFPPAAEPGTRELGPLGDGYILKEPDATGRWEVESYRWDPGLVVAHEGERLTLEIVGINGARHDAMVVSPSGARPPSSSHGAGSRSFDSGSTRPGSGGSSAPSTPRG